jgi:alpha-galactosidase
MNYMPESVQPVFKQEADEVVSLIGGGMLLIIDCDDQKPSVVYWGIELSHGSNIAQVGALMTAQVPRSSPSNDHKITLIPTDGEGFLGQSGLRCHREGQSWAVDLKLSSIEQSNEHSVIFNYQDNDHGVTVKQTLAMDAATGLVCYDNVITNLNDQVLQLDWLASATLPIPAACSDIIGFEGRWGKEFQLKRTQRFCGLHVRENKAGRTSQDSYPAIIVAEPDCKDLSGTAYAFHLGWSGNHRLYVEERSDSRNLVGMGELLLPGEIRLAKDDSYASPTMYGVFSNTGLNGVTQAFHAFVRSDILRPQISSKKRPVHFNTWEALYFDHTPEGLMRLAERAAELGAERYVLDDGWFRNRNDDTAGLGDWFVDEERYPEGLQPIIDKVHSLDMEFGIWFEPEMVNPESDLYKAHPDWTLSHLNASPIQSRNQLVLDFSRQEVCDYIFDCVDSLLQQYDIKYIKWDMNRDLHQPTNYLGQAGVHKHVQALYKMLSGLRDKHPHVEIESCSSGGARADLGILRYTDRFWASDSNDAVDRLSIQKGISLFLPPEIMGSHIGPYDCHLTGRKLDPELRSAVSLFGHMGVEADPDDSPQADLDVCKQGIALHKKFRHLVHHGQLYRFELNKHSDAFGVISNDKTEALYSYVELGGYPRHLASQYCFHGLDDSQLYEFNVVWPSNLKTPTPEIITSLNGRALPGDWLKQVGIRMPLLLPQSCVLIHLKVIEA